MTQKEELQFSGLFLLDPTWIDISYRTSIGKDKKSELYIFYSGIIFPDPSRLERFVGKMNDHFGQSDLFNIHIGQGKISFDSYGKFKYPINFSFYCKKGELWVGEYDGIALGCGETQCHISESSYELFKKISYQ